MKVYKRLLHRRCVAIQSAAERVGWNISISDSQPQSGADDRAARHRRRNSHFTRVAHFGGGFIPPHNQLSGNPTPAPECLQPENATNMFVEEGTTETEPTAGSDQLPAELPTGNAAFTRG
jgi:hypothetical protein